MGQPSGAQVEDLGGPTPENYRPDDDSAKLKDPAATLAQVKDIVNAKAGKAEAGAGTKAEDAQPEGDVIEEEPTAEANEEVVAEEETTEEEVIEEEETIDIEADVQAPAS